MRELNVGLSNVYEIIVNKDNVIESVTLNHIVQSNNIQVVISCGLTIFMVKSSNIILAINHIQNLLRGV